MPVGKIARRKSWLAGLLQLLLPGLGNLYCGKPFRGLVLHISMFIAAIAGSLVFAWIPGLPALLTYVAGAVALRAFMVVDGVRCARAAGPTYILARYNRWYVYVLVVVAVLVGQVTLLPLALNASLVRAYRIPTPSMEDTLLLGDHLLADRSTYLFSNPARGDIATYQSPEGGKVYVHRIVGLPGETLEIRERAVLINGIELQEPYATFQVGNRYREPVPPIVLAAGEYYLLGDNRDNSMDSRYSGVVHRSRLLGKATMLYYSEDPETQEIRWDRIGKVLE
jgi:signal peptidase I